MPEYECSPNAGQRMNASSRCCLGKAFTMSCNMTRVVRHGAQADQQVAACLQPRRLGRVQPPQPRRRRVPAGYSVDSMSLHSIRKSWSSESALLGCVSYEQAVDGSGHVPNASCHGPHPHCASCSASDDRSAVAISGWALSSMAPYVVSEYSR